jgi:hypothetical protein
MMLFSITIGGKMLSWERFYGRTFLIMVAHVAKD